MRRPIPSRPCAIKYKGKRYHKHTVLVVISNINGEREVKFPDVIAENPALV